MRETLLWDTSDNDDTVTKIEELAFDPHVQEVPENPLVQATMVLHRMQLVVVFELWQLWAAGFIERSYWGSSCQYKMMDRRKNVAEGAAAVREGAAAVVGEAST